MVTSSVQTDAGVTFSDVAPFHLHLDVIGVVVAAVIGLEYGVRRLAPAYAPRGEPPITGRQRLAFYSGIATVLVVSGYPFHDIGERSLFMFHMVEHLGIALVAVPLLLYGTPWWLMRLLVKPVMPALRVLTRPLVALLAFNGTLALLHAPSVVERMVVGPAWFHFFMHALLFITAVMMWWPVIGPIPDIPRLAPFPRMGYLFLQSLVPTIPATFLTLGHSALYKVYDTFPRLWGISAHSDQIMAGLIMKLGGGLLLWGFIAATFFTWWKDEQSYAPTRRIVKHTS